MAPSADPNGRIAQAFASVPDLQGKVDLLIQAVCLVGDEALGNQLFEIVEGRAGTPNTALESVPEEERADVEDSAEDTVFHQPEEATGEAFEDQLAAGAEGETDEEPAPTL